MKRVAALYDIHGNLPALDAVLAEVHVAGVEAIVAGGDVIVGPMSREVLERLSAQTVPVQYLYGNCEIAVLRQFEGHALAGVPDVYRPTIVWTAQQIGERYRETLAAWPKTLRLHLDGIGSVVFCHGTPRDENEIFTRSTSEERLRPIFDPLDAALVVCGHTHMPFDRRVGRTRVVNAGSVGMPFGARGADWLLLGPDVRFRHTAYDVSAAAASVRAAGYPDPGDFFARGVTDPPSAEDMERAYERATAKD